MSHNGQSNTYNLKGCKPLFADPVTQYYIPPLLPYNMLIKLYNFVCNFYHLQQQIIACNRYRDMLDNQDRLNSRLQPIMLKSSPIILSSNSK